METLKSFSHPLFQPFTIYTKSSILDVQLRSEYASGAVNFFSQRLHSDVWMCSRYASDIFNERQKLRKTFKLVIFKNVGTKIKKWFLWNLWENLYWEMIFFTVNFSKFCKKFRSSHQRCSIKKAVPKKFAKFTGKHLSWSFFSLKSQDWKPTTLLKRNSNTGVFLWIF